MMRNLSQSLIFTVPLSSSAHHLAEQFRRQQSNQKKAKQVYLNTLAVSAVNFYLHCMGIETNWEGSQSRDPVMLSILDVADVEIPNLGKLECRPVLPQDKVLYIPLEVWSDRIGYVAVQFDQSLKQATLLGFSETAGNGELPISELRSLEDLPEHLRQIRQTEQVLMRVNLSQWFENIFEPSWQSMEALLGTQRANLALSLRSTPEASVERGKRIDLGIELTDQSVILVVALTPENDKEMNILVEVRPTSGQIYLPPNLQLMALDEEGAVLMEAQTRSSNNFIQLQFSGFPGEYFTVKVALGNVSVSENFVI
ncbi:DUF1822 family protein [Trichocoleus sp. FACHB-90]|uniref:DUF1822 family protein n=1 Tax=Cyanophyceae TaxID=3028117 RepID=UPI001683F934|nr:DUF1822 family protein [Trichocoleus sp. FACHB-90]MBD1929914.1 DUF1822 family protein [Trichocoleus sp. FACHB-90]